MDNTGIPKFTVTTVPEEYEKEVVSGFSTTTVTRKYDPNGRTHFIMHILDWKLIQGIERSLGADTQIYPVTTAFFCFMLDKGFLVGSKYVHFAPGTIHISAPTYGNVDEIRKELILQLNQFFQRLIRKEV